MYTCVYLYMYIYANTYWYYRRRDLIVQLVGPTGAEQGTTVALITPQHDFKKARCSLVPDSETMLYAESHT